MRVVEAVRWVQNWEEVSTLQWPQPLSGSWSQEQILQHIRRHPFWLAQIDHSVAALILFRELGEAVEIDYVLTLPRYRRQGLMEQALGRVVQSHQGSPLWLEVHVDNRAALRLYEKMGFKNKGLRPRYYADGGDGLLMVRPPQTLKAS
jgi:ribosomal protein S18 acetylase RimI-like enzyme